MAQPASWFPPRMLWASVVMVLLFAGAAVTVRLLDSRPRPSTPDIRIALSGFSLKERSGEIVTNADLLGRIWIADFIFTSCAGPCPQMTAHMRRLQDDLAGVSNLRLVSISVDPERDTPAVLSDYARRVGADPQRWLFLTGPMDQIYDLAIDGFKIAVQAARENQQIIHDSRFILVDGQGMIRGYYDSNSADERARLRSDVLALADRGT